MAKDRPVQGGDYDRADWRDAVYPVRLIKSDEVENRYYHSEPWTDTNGNERRADDPVEQTQFKLTFEVLAGEKQGDWLWAFAAHGFGTKKDGSLWGNRAKIAHAMNPEWKVDEGIESDNSDLIGGVLNAVITPKADPQYAKVVAWLPMLPEDKAKHETPETEAKPQGVVDGPVDMKAEWKAIVSAYQAKKTRAEVMARLGSPKGAAEAFAAFEELGADARAELLEIAENRPPSETFDDDIPF